MDGASCPSLAACVPRPTPWPVWRPAPFRDLDMDLVNMVCRTGDLDDFLMCLEGSACT